LKGKRWHAQAAEREEPTKCATKRRRQSVRRSVGARCHPLSRLLSASPISTQKGLSCPRYTRYPASQPIPITSRPIQFPPTNPEAPYFVAEARPIPCGVASLFWMATKSTKDTKAYFVIYVPSVANSLWALVVGRWAFALLLSVRDGASLFFLS
jgi:hypothetical protein